ncbi:amino acid ABC transporter permease [Aliirhizobium smilacinae]|uniref:Glutamate/aspartate import permease protein GltK n=1 Tax=Aliirhizobium smilacinae TaxID=1395944 RepID=A0A5C4XJB8_9HYPH|nr:amino acid ABC transporter permease [Rhizobium smilacinae]TNM63398.1 amino acid ABC transporter permease [Rhizobium smilacinae]
MRFFDPAAFVDYLFNHFLMGGVLVTIGLTLASVAGGLVLGMIIALMRMSQNLALYGFARTYIWFFRGTPLLIQLVVIYTGLPQLGIKLGVINSALIGLILHEASYLAEIIRSGFMSVPQGQREAAWALSVPRRTIFWRVTLPQAFRLMIPPFGNSVNSLLKATSLASVISVEEIMRRSDMLMQEHFQILEVYAAAAVYYLLLVSVWDLIQQRLESHFGRSLDRNAKSTPAKRR